jgi:hypothetical protein
MFSNIEKFRRLYESSHGRPFSKRSIEYTVEVRSSSATFEPYATKSRKKLAEQLIILSSQLQEFAEQDAGHHALYVYAKQGTSNPELISMQKFSLFLGEWVCLNGVELAYETLDPHRIAETLERYEASMETQDPIDDPEVDDDPTPPGERKRSMWREKVKSKNTSSSKQKKPWSLPTTVMGASLETGKVRVK